MPLQTVKFLPGVNTEVTPTLGEAMIVDSQLIRFKYAGSDVVAEKLGGWTKFYPLSLGSAVRELHAWEGIRADAHLAAGCEGSLQIITDGTAVDVTPHFFLSNATVSFNTTNTSVDVTIDDPNLTASVYDSIFILTPVSIGGIVLSGAYQVTGVIDADSYKIESTLPATATVAAGGAVPTFTTTTANPTVTVTLNDHGYAVGEIFDIPASAATTVGGITLSGAYLVQSVPSANTFTINNAISAASGATASENGGKVQIAYYIGVGPSIAAGGYGSGGYGSGGYGVGSTPTPSLGSPITTTNWTLDNWGEILLACPTDGPIYEYSTDTGISVATKIVAAPQVNGGIFVSEPAQILVAWASSTGGVQDPLLINWSDAGDFENWTVSSQTQAGGYRLPTGSKIVGGAAGPNFGIIWTDVGVWAMDYIEPPFIFGFNSLGSNCGLIGRHAYAILNSVAYWMSFDKFCILNGETVQILPCTVWDFVFQNLDEDHTDKIYAGTNSLFDEVTFYFPSKSGGAGEIDSYVKYCVGLNVWDFGKLQRTAWIDQSPVGEPVAGDASGYIYQHEVSPDADGQPMMSHFTSGYFEIADGEQLMFVDWIFPDFKYGYYAGTTGAVVQIGLNFTNYPNGLVKSVGPYSVMSTTEYVNTRLRAREVSVTISSSDLGSFWRVGGIKMRSAPDGKR